MANPVTQSGLPPLQSPRAAKIFDSVNDEAETARRFALYSLHNSRNELWTGDTLVLIDFPPNVKHTPTDCFGIAWTSIKVRVSSEKLDATGSAKFASLRKVFGGRAMQKAQKHGLTDADLKGVKYIMDLTPAHEGDDLVFQMMELSLSPGITHWWTAVKKHGVPNDIAGGHDDVCTCWMPSGGVEMDTPLLSDTIKDYCITRSTPEDESLTAAPVFTLAHAGRGLKVQKMKQDGKTEAASFPPYRNIPDYCPIRHRLNILRLLYIIESKPITIDSAPRLWTLFALAKIFDCIHLVVPWARGWFSARANSHIMEILPEEVLQMAMGMRFVDITKCSFRILVNELALELTAEHNVTPAQTSASRVTVFGRKKRDVGDDLKNVIEHAAQALADRTTNLLDVLSSSTVFEQLHIKEWVWLLNVETMLEALKKETGSYGVLHQLQDLKTMILNSWEQDLVEPALDADFMEMQLGMDDDRALYVEPADWHSMDNIYCSLGKYQKVLLPLFYETFTKSWQDGPFLGGTIRGAKRHLDVSKAANIFNAKLGLWRIENAHVLVGTEWGWLLSNQANFGIATLDAQVSAALAPIVLNQWTHNNISPSLPLSRHLLLNLTQNELKYLPLWAGGNDDGTGGVFEDRVLPPALMGPVGPGPSFHTGYSSASDASSCSGSISSDLRALDIQSTVGPASLDVQDSSASTVYNRGRIVADDVSIHSEAFTDDTDTANAYHDARFETSTQAHNMNVDESAAQGGEDPFNGVDYEWEADSDDTLSGVESDDDMILL